MIIPESARPWLLKQRTTPGKESEIEDAAMRLWDMLPDSDLEPLSILDIGCGIGLSTFYLNRHLTPSILCGIDGTGNASVQGGPATNGAWNDLAVTRELLDANGLEGVDLFEIGGDIPWKFDMLASFASWGWHYPIDTYDYRKLLNPGGLITIDVRRGLEDQVPADWELIDSRIVNHKQRHCLYRLKEKA